MALVSFEKLTRAAPANPDYWYNLAMAYAKMQQKANAQKACAKALQIAPNHAPALQLMPQLNALP
jgi:tetratricopeptide (TPR) repeat protein